jgi:phenylacetate-CoA ligase
MARFMEEEKLAPLSFSVKAVFTSSDVLRPDYRETIERVFGGPVYDLYGSAERVAAIGMCERKTYHVLPENGIIEFIPVNNSSITMEIAGTGLHNYAMPLLRYRTGDLADISSIPCKCGRCFKTIRGIRGRIVDFMTSRDGAILMEGSCLLLKGVENIIESQIVQEDLEEIRMKFVPADNFSEKDKRKIVENARTYLGSGAHVTFEEADSLMEEGVYKFRPFISRINNSR